jgi:hypothetical protein
MEGLNNAASSVALSPRREPQPCLRGAGAHVRPGHGCVTPPWPASALADRVGVKKLPIALALIAAASFSMAACNDDDPDPAPTSTTVDIPVVPSASVSVSPVPCISVSVSPSDSVKNDVPGDGGVAYHPSVRRALRPAPDKTTPAC